MKLYTVHVLRMYMMENNPGPKYFKGDNFKKNNSSARQGISFFMS